MKKKGPVFVTDLVGNVKKTNGRNGRVDAKNAYAFVRHGRGDGFRRLGEIARKLALTALTIESRLLRALPIGGACLSKTTEKLSAYLAAIKIK